MDANTITTFISSVGFPIAMCVYMVYTWQKTSETHKAEIDELRTAIENNTVAVVKLVERLEKD